MSNLGFLPVALVALSIFTFILSYAIAVADGDVSAAFPYISDTGSKRPESSIFSLLLNISVFLAFSTMYVRFKAVQSLSITLIDDRWLRRMNNWSMIAGIVACLGCALVANFQEGSEVEDVHLTGAALTFGFGIFYCFLQAALSFHMNPEFNGRRICVIRLTISLVSIISAMLTLASGMYAIHEWNQTTHQPGDTKLKWSPKDAGFVPHIVSTVGEWLTAVSFFCFFLTYVSEFNKFEIAVKIRPLVYHLDESPVSLSDANERTPLLT